jgi:hypothetical protein
MPAGEFGGTAVTGVATGGDADRGVTALYREHYRSLVRLAAFLVRDVATAMAHGGGWPAGSPRSATCAGRW